MAELWTDIIDPVELSGYARDYMEEYELQNGTLARYLPNRQVADIAVELVVGDSGLVPEARYRAYDAAPEIGTEPGGESIMLKLPAISQTIPVSEYTQLRVRNASDDAIRNQILRTMRRVVRAIADRAERTRGIVIATGAATVNQKNFGFNDDFGRSAEMNVEADDLWSVAASDRLEFLHDVVEAYTVHNGRPPGSILLDRTVFGSLGRGDQFRVQLNNGASRPMAADDVRQILVADDLPPLDLYSRRTASGAVLPSDSLWLMPAPVDPNDEDGSEYGATTWGQTLTSTLPDWGIEDSEQPGIVVGVTRHNGIPAIAEVQGDSISLPTAANADLAMRVKVL
jgi:hypothetical protein